MRGPHDDDDRTSSSERRDRKRERGVRLPAHTTRGAPSRARAASTEIRGPLLQRRWVRAICATCWRRWATHVDALKFAGGSFTLMPERALREIIEIAARARCARLDRRLHRARAHAGAGGRRPLHRRGRELGFDIVEISAGFISIPTDDMLRLVERVQRAGLKAKPEVGIQFGAGGATTAEELEQEGTRDVGWRDRTGAALPRRRRLHDHDRVRGDHRGGHDLAHRRRRTIARALGLEKVMFEAADPEVFGWYVKNYGPEVNLFVDHSQIVQLECLRSGIWGTKSLWGRVVTYKG